MTTLLRQIQDAAIDSTVSLPTLLRKCKVLAARLGNDEFKAWVDHELNGYPDSNLAPPYRTSRVNSKGHFSGPFQSGLRNADIPLICIGDDDFRQMLSTCRLTQAASALESLAKSALDAGKGSLQEAWNPDITALFGQDIYENMNCVQAWKVIPTNFVVAAVDSIRTMVLNFALEIEMENPSAGEAPANTSPVNQARVSNIFNTVVHGNVQNLAQGNADTVQTATLTEQPPSEIFDKLLKAIQGAPLPADVSAKVCTSVEEMRASKDTKSLGQKYVAFVSTLSDHMTVLGPIVAPFLPALAALAHG